jgi:hypothetical protein
MLTFIVLSNVKIIISPYRISRLIKADFKGKKKNVYKDRTKAKQQILKKKKT